MDDQSNDKHLQRYFEKSVEKKIFAFNENLLPTDEPFKRSLANHSTLASLFDGFVITAYTENGSPIRISPNIIFPLGKYQATMSSVPGFPITIESENTERIQLKVTSGSLLSWTPPDSQVMNKGQITDMKSGDTIYWSPPRTVGNPDPALQLKAGLEITAYNHNKQIGSSRIEIESDKNSNYTGKLLK